MIMEIADKVLRTMEKVISNEIPVESCHEKEQVAKLKRERVRKVVFENLRDKTKPFNPVSEMK